MLLSPMDKCAGRARGRRAAAPAVLFGLLALVASSGAGAQMTPVAAQTPSLAPAPVPITLAEAIARAQQNEPAFAASRAEQRAAALDRGIARAALLPGVVAHNQVLYTQPNGVGNQAGQTGQQPAPIFIANNAVREYASQAIVTETLSVAQVAAVHAADANAMRAKAELEVQRRGLVAATAGLFYGVLAAQQRLAVFERARDEAADFVQLTGQRETAREAAHADVVKATLTLEGRTRDLADAVLARDRARLELAVLLFADPLTPFTLQLPASVAAVPSMAEVQQAATKNNPELASAFATLRQSDAEVLSARAAYLPDLGLNFTYGIDAAQFATKGPFDTNNQPPRNPKNLGYSIAATVDLPVWDWLSTERRVKQSEIRRDAVRAALTAAQRRLIVNLQQDYAEAQTAQAQLTSLDQSVGTAADSLQLTRLRYSNGEATVLEVVDAESSLYTAQTAEADGQVRYQQALSSLQTLTGILP